MLYLEYVSVHYYIEHTVFDLLGDFETNLMPVRVHHKIVVCAAGCYGLQCQTPLIGQGRQ